ncbi:MAG: synthase [Candidatus Woesearchaeota archaeon]|nr:synthase [Candidatus Woesearchaeota archaeon]
MTLQNKLEELKSYMSIDSEALTILLENFIKEYTKKLDREGVVIGLSGGLDSAVTAAICERALGSDKVLALIMPEADSKKENVEDAISFAEELNIETRLIDITKYLKVIGAYRLFPLNKLPLSKGIKEGIVKKSYKFFEKQGEETPFFTRPFWSKRRQIQFLHQKNKCILQSKA